MPEKSEIGCLKAAESGSPTYSATFTSSSSFQTMPAASLEGRG